MNKNQLVKQLSEELVQLKEAEKDTFARICNKLFQVNYITRKKISDANDYRFILAYKDLFTAYFGLSDFELLIHRHEEVVFIKNLSTFNHLRLKKEESILLLVLRMMYQAKLEYVTLDENVEVYLSDIHQELAKIGYLDNKRMTKERLKPALQLIKNYNVIDYMDKNLRDDARVKIYPSILFVVSIDSIKEMVDHLDQYLQGGDSFEETDEN